MRMVKEIDRSKIALIKIRVLEAIFERLFVPGHSTN